jgi:hypothetical protein
MDLSNPYLSVLRNLRSMGLLNTTEPTSTFHLYIQNTHNFDLVYAWLLLLAACGPFHTVLLYAWSLPAPSFSGQHANCLWPGAGSCKTPWGIMKVGTSRRVAYDPRYCAWKKSATKCIGMWLKCGKDGKFTVTCIY